MYLLVTTIHSFTILIGTIHIMVDGIVASIGTTDTDMLIMILSIMAHIIITMGIIITTIIIPIIMDIIITMDITPTIGDITTVTTMAIGMDIQATMNIITTIQLPQVKPIMVHAKVLEAMCLAGM